MAAGPRTLDNNQQQTILVIPARLQPSDSIEGTEDRAGLVVNQTSHIEHIIDTSSPEESPDNNEHHNREIVKRPGVDDEFETPHSNIARYRSERSDSDDSSEDSNAEDARFSHISDRESTIGDSDGYVQSDSEGSRSDNEIVDWMEHLHFQTDDNQQAKAIGMEAALERIRREEALEREALERKRKEDRDPKKKGEGTETDPLTYRSAMQRAYSLFRASERERKREEMLEYHKKRREENSATCAWQRIMERTHKTFRAIKLEMMEVYRAQEKHLIRKYKEDRSNSSKRRLAWDDELKEAIDNKKIRRQRELLQGNNLLKAKFFNSKAEVHGYQERLETSLEGLWQKESTDRAAEWEWGVMDIPATEGTTRTVEVATLIGEESTKRARSTNVEETLFVNSAKFIRGEDGPECEQHTAVPLPLSVLPTILETDEMNDSIEPEDFADAIIDNEKRQALLHAVLRQRANRKRSKPMHSYSMGQKAKRRVEAEENREITLPPEVIYLGNGTAELSQKQERQIWRAILAERQEEEDEKKAMDEYDKLVDNNVLEMERKREYYNNKGLMLRKTYRQLLEQLKNLTISSTEHISGIPIPILTVADWCRSAHIIHIDGQVLSTADRLSLAALDEAEERLIAEEEQEEVLMEDEEALKTKLIQSAFIQQKRTTLNQRLSEKAIKRVVQEQSSDPATEQYADPLTGDILTRRIPLARVIERIQKGLNEAELRLQMLKVHVEIALTGEDAAYIQRMILRGEHLVRTLHVGAGIYGEKRQQLIDKNKVWQLNERIAEESEEIARLSDVRRMTTSERREYVEKIQAWIKVIEREHQEDELLKNVRRKRQRQLEWSHEVEKLPKLTAGVYLDKEQVEKF